MEYQIVSQTGEHKIPTIRMRAEEYAVLSKIFEDALKDKGIILPVQEYGRQEPLTRITLISETGKQITLQIAVEPLSTKV